MRNAIGPLRFLCVASLVSVAACAAQDDPVVTSLAGARQPERASPVVAPVLDGDSSLAALTAEVRQLRLAVEELARSQSQAQALGVYLSAQQTRLKDADERLFVARREVDAATAAREDLESRVLGLLAEQPRASPDKRAEIDDAITAFRMEQTRLDRELQQARGREDDLSRELQSEEARWNDLIARLEALAR